MRRVRLFALILAVMLLLQMPFLFSCNRSNAYQTHMIFAMDTVIEIKINAEKNAENLFYDCENLIIGIENEVSRTKTGSDVYDLNENGEAECRENTLSLVKAACSVYDMTDGAFDITVLPLTELYRSYNGLDTPPNSQAILDAISKTGMDKVTVNGTKISLEQDTGIDLGGIAKGYSAEKLLELIEENTETYGIRNGIISFGGAVTVFGDKPDGSPYRIALRDPGNENGKLGSIILKDGETVSVSGDYERYVTIGGKKYHHIIDTKTGLPADTGIRSVSVISDNGTFSDALSTALFIMGYERSMELYHSKNISFEAVFIMSDGTVKVTDNIEYRK